MRVIALVVSFMSMMNAASAALYGDHYPTTCAAIKAPSIENAKIVAFESDEKLHYTVPAEPPFLNEDITNLNICEAKVTIRHEGAEDDVLMQVWLPLDGWNGRFTAVGGTGWAAGLGNLSLAPVVAKGYAAAVTDAGLSGDLTSPALWALRKNGSVDLDLLENFASRSIHDLAVTGKAITASFYGAPAKYSYWNGCSTGGRQGMVAAQKYPDDFDGILAGAPALSWPRYVVAEHWAQVVMKAENTFPSTCELDAVTQAAIATCDELDGVKDNVVTDLKRCNFNPSSIVGSKKRCDGKDVTIPKSVATVVQKIWEGPKKADGSPLWYGLNIGAPLDSLASTTIVDGRRVGSPFFISDGWMRYFVRANSEFNVSAVDAVELRNLFRDSQKSFGDLIGSDNPDLAGLRDSGGKLLVWHGEADQLIFPQGTKRYRQNVERLMGGSEQVDEFFRLFLAPGVDHCGLGTTAGAIPSDPFHALTSWVEKGIAPDVLPASTLPKAVLQFSRNICRFPFMSKYHGHGDPTSSTSFDCVRP